VVRSTAADALSRGSLKPEEAVMQLLSRARGRVLAAVLAACGVLLIGAPQAGATNPPLTWTACGEAAGVECATAEVPKDWRNTRGEKWQIAVARSPATEPANRIGRCS
jgi:hypothetical protein